MGFGKDGKGVIMPQAIQVAAGDFSSNAAQLVGTAPAIRDDFRMLKTEGTCIVKNLTSTEGSGLKLYLADGEYTLTEIEEAIEQSQGPLDANSTQSAEIADRFIRLVGVSELASAAGNTVVFRGMNGSPILSFNPRWTFGTAGSWKWVIYNRGVTLTVGATINLDMTNYGVWIR